MFRPLYVGHLQIEIQLTNQLYKICGHLSVDWVGGVARSRFSIMVTMTQSCYEWIFL